MLFCCFPSWILGNLILWTKGFIHQRGSISSRIFVVEWKSIFYLNENFREDRAGVKFKDAELIGIPFQIIVGRDSVNNEVELICRTNNTKLKISANKLLETFISESEIMYNKYS